MSGSLRLALLSHVVFLQLLCLNNKTWDRALGHSAGRIKLPRRSLSVYQTVPRETYWYDIQFGCIGLNINVFRGYTLTASLAAQI